MLSSTHLFHQDRQREEGQGGHAAPAPGLAGEAVWPFEAEAMAVWRRSQIAFVISPLRSRNGSRPFYLDSHVDCQA